jgi:hypothetical protein
MRTFSIPSTFHEISIVIENHNELVRLLQVLDFYIGEDKNQFESCDELAKEIKEKIMQENNRYKVILRK